MAIRSHAPDQEDHGIDLAPMLDFVLNLLIFFIITTSFVKQTGAQIDKPFADTAEHRESGNLLIAISRTARSGWTASSSTCANCDRRSRTCTSSGRTTRS